jgi:hypothetical protein
LEPCKFGIALIIPVLVPTWDVLASGFSDPMFERTFKAIEAMEQKMKDKE